MFPVYFTLLLLWLGHFLVDYMIGVWAVYKTLAGLDLAKAGLIAGLSAFAGEGMQLFFGSLSDQGHRRLLISVGLLATTASIFMAYTQDYLYLFFLFLITCLGSGAFHPAAAGLTGIIAKEKKGLFLALLMSGGSLGLASSQLIFTAMYENFNGQIAFLIIPSVFLACVIAFFGLSEKPVARPINGHKLDLKVFLRFFQHQGLRNLYLTQVGAQALFWGTVFLLPDLLLYRGYSEWVSLGGGHLCLILGGALMIIPGGYMADRFSARSVLLITQILGLGFFYTLLVFPHLSPVALCFLLFAMGASFGLVQPVVVAMGNNFVPTRPGMVSAFLMGLVWCVAEGLGQGGGGLITKLFEEDATAKALSILGIMGFMAILATFRLPVKISDDQKCEFAV